jgi:hypothetical protein
MLTTISIAHRLNDVTDVHDDAEFFDAAPEAIGGVKFVDYGAATARAAAGRERRKTWRWRALAAPARLPNEGRAAAMT